MTWSIPKIIFPVVGAVIIGANAIALHGTSNSLTKLDVSSDVMYERVVEPEFIDSLLPGSFYMDRNQTSIEKKIRAGNPFLLDTSSSYSAWDAVLKVYAKTLSGTTKNKLINDCKSLVTGDLSSLTLVGFQNRVRITGKFCSFPIKVKDKLTQEMVHQYKTWPNKSNNDSLWNLFEREKKKSKMGDPCKIFMESYTVMDDVTIMEIDFIKRCYSVIM